MALVWASATATSADAPRQGPLWKRGLDQKTAQNGLGNETSCDCEVNF